MRGKIFKSRTVQYIVAFIVCIAIVEFGDVVAKADGPNMNIDYRIYTAESGSSVDETKDGAECISNNKEAITALKMFITIPNDEATSQTQDGMANVKYSVYSKEADWSEAVENGSKASSSDNPIKAIKVEISGTLTTEYQVEYRVLNVNGEWSKWCTNGEVAGNTAGDANLVGVQAKIAVKPVPTQAPEVSQTVTTPSTNNDAGTVTTPTTDNNTGVVTTPTNNTSAIIDAFVQKAAGEIGQKADANNVTKYGEWYQNNVDSSATFKDKAWCAMFLSWCANQAGVSKKTVGYYAACSYWQNKFFVANGTWHAASGYTPEKGDIIFFDYDYARDGEANHNGIVESVTETQVVVIEGNAKVEGQANSVQRITYERNHKDILGYGKPNYAKNAENVEADKNEQASNAGTTGSGTTPTTTTGQANAIADMARTQLHYKEGNDGYSKYGEWYEKNIDSSYNFSHDHWCACFVSWCANQVGVSKSVIKPYAACRTGVSNFQSQGVWHARSSSYTPKKGDIIFFTFSHTGIVEYVSNGYVHTIEGNSSDAVRERSYSLSYGSIKGYGSPKYN